MIRKTFLLSIILCFLTLPATISWGFLTTSGPFLPLPTQKEREKAYNPTIAELGQKLFNDARLSKDNQITCNNCHNNQLNGVDGRPKAIGPDNMIASFNTPSLYNATLLYKIFWEGKQTNIHTAIESHIQDPTIMAGKWPDILAALSNDSLISQNFKQHFKTGLTEKNIVTALVHYLTSLNYAPSRFDVYLKGDLTALSPEEKAGLHKFMTLGCHFCHQGKLLGGNLIMPLGIFYPYPDNMNKKKYKVPSLRNVTKTAPYFHDGSISTLEEAVKIMAKYQTGTELKDHEANSIILFLKTLEADLLKGTPHAP